MSSSLMVYLLTGINSPMKLTQLALQVLLFIISMSQRCNLNVCYFHMWELQSHVACCRLSPHPVAAIII